MKPITIGNGEIRVLPLAFESLGVRGMSMFVKTDDVKLVIDPGSALGQRFNLYPHECEYVALSDTAGDYRSRPPRRRAHNQPLSLRPLRAELRGLDMDIELSGDRGGNLLWQANFGQGHQQRY